MSDLAVSPPDLAPTQRQPWWQRHRMQISTVTMLVLLYIVFVVFAPDVYLRFDIYRSFMISIPFFGIMAIAMTYIVTLGEIDLSFPSICGIAGWAFSQLYISTHVFILGLAVALLVGAGAGLINGLLVARMVALHEAGQLP